MNEIYACRSCVELGNIPIVGGDRAKSTKGIPGLCPICKQQAFLFVVDEDEELKGILEGVGLPRDLTVANLTKAKKLLGDNVKAEHLINKILTRRRQ